MAVITIELPFPISANVYWGHRAVRSNGKWISQVYVTPKARAYKALIKTLCKDAGITPTDKPVSILVHAFMPAINRDLMNSPKVLEDALEGAAYINDKQIVDARYIRHEARSPKTKNAKVVVTIRQVDYDE